MPGTPTFDAGNPPARICEGEAEWHSYSTAILPGGAGGQLPFALNIGIASTNTYLLHWPYQVTLAVLAVVISSTSYLLSRFWIFRASLAKQSAPSSSTCPSPEAVP